MIYDITMQWYSAPATIISLYAHQHSDFVSALLSSQRNFSKFSQFIYLIIYFIG